MGVCMAMTPAMQRGGLLRCLVSSSSVQMDPISGGAASWRFPGGGLLGPWGVAAHGEEETVVQLMKRVRMPSSKVAPAGVVVLVGGDGGVSLAPLISGETLDLREATIDGGAHGRRSPHWRR
jgi:hypothetical protein